MIEVPFQVPFQKPFIGHAEIKEMIETLESGWLTTGPRTAQFEKEFAEYIGSKYAVGVTSCTAAMHLSLLALGIGPGDEVITPAMSWIATPNAIEYTGAKPVFVDVEPDTGNIDTIKVKQAITPRTKAILPVHMYGRPYNMLRLSLYKLPIVADCAHAIEAMYQNHKVGNLTDLSCFSFWGTKNLSTGEGGMVTTDEEELANNIRRLRSFGLKDGKRTSIGAYSQIELGYKYNMFDIQAALGIHQLRRIEERWTERFCLSIIYNNKLSVIGGIKVLSLELENTRHAHHLYPILIEKDRNIVAARMKELGVSTSIHFQALHLEPYYANKYGYKRGMFPEAEYIGDHELSLPFWPEMTGKQQNRVVKVLKEALASAQS